MDSVRPATSEEFASAMQSAAEEQSKIRIGGSFTKDGMAGPVVTPAVCMSTTRLSRVLQYEPKDLTVSVEAGLLWSDLSRLLAENGQMVPLDPPWFDRATVGGVIASNTSGPRRRLYGTARDLVIGMQFATQEGKLVQSGGMVVKNVAGLVTGKLMIGSFGTLAAITSVNFKVTPIPEASRTFAYSFDTADQVIAMRDRVLRSVLQPAAIDLLNPAAADRVGLKGHCLLLQAAGVEPVLARYSRELGGSTELAGEDETQLWTAIREFVPNYLSGFPAGAVVRQSTTLTGVRDVIA